MRKKKYLNYYNSNRINRGCKNMIQSAQAIMFDTNKTFNSETDLIIDNRVFRNVKVQHEKVETYDWDGITRKTTYLHGKDADYVTWQENGRLCLSEKSYHKAKTKLIGGKVFDNILSNKMYSDGTRIYEKRMSDGGIQKITVSPGGDILKIKSYPKIKEKLIDKISRGILKLTTKLPRC